MSTRCAVRSLTIHADDVQIILPARNEELLNARSAAQWRMRGSPHRPFKGIHDEHVAVASLACMGITSTPRSSLRRALINPSVTRCIWPKLRQR
jgi:hypothetical protein